MATAEKRRPGCRTPNEFPEALPAAPAYRRDSQLRSPATSFSSGAFSFTIETALLGASHFRFAFVVILASACLAAGGCLSPLGPGYLVEKQHVDVQFLLAMEHDQLPKVRVEATYQLRNTGNQKLSLLEARLPGGRRLHLAGAQVAWDGAAVALAPSTETPRISVLTLPEAWPVSARRTLRISYDVASASGTEAGLTFTNDAFFLPAANWSPEILPYPGLLGFGGAPPKKWELSLRLPQGFLAHASGANAKTSRSAGEQVVRAVQTPADRYPFVVAGRYAATEVGDAKPPMLLWTRNKPAAESLKQVSDEMARTFGAYDAAFGRRARRDSPLWIVECPAPRGCFSNATPLASLLLGEDASQRPTAELASSDTVLVDLSRGMPQLAAVAAPSLAASWLGYGQNPGFYEQVPPLSVFPAFAAAIGREALEGPAYRTALIRRALGRIPKRAETQNTAGKPKEEDLSVVRAKSFLFFYGLEDRYGPEVFRKATSHMLEARRGRGFDISDLIAAFDQETHQNTAEFVRMWMKRPGVPEDFRARYESNSAADHSAKETFR
jgi:hypothetical protein